MNPDSKASFLKAITSFLNEQQFCYTAAQLFIKEINLLSVTSTEQRIGLWFFQEAIH